MKTSKRNDRPTRWIFISDMQLGHSSAVVSDNDERARQLIELVAAENPDFVINGGDHINGAIRARECETDVDGLSSRHEASAERLSGDIDGRESRPDRVGGFIGGVLPADRSCRQT